MQTTASSVAALDLGRIGLWTVTLRFQPPEVAAQAAQEIEALGYKTVWIPGGIDDSVLATFDQLLEATSHLKFASGILNIWKHDPVELAAWFNGKSPEHKSRLLLGLGVSHGPLIGEAYQHPLAKVNSFLDDLLGAGMPADRLCIAALGPKMLELAAARTAGSHPYLINPDHTAFARKTMGPGALLAPEQGVVLDADPAKAREIARAAVKNYTRLPNYLNSWARLGFSEAEMMEMTDRFIDSIVAWGDVAAIGANAKAHLDAGADHVCLQVLTGGFEAIDFGREREAWKDLATLL